MSCRRHVRASDGRCPFCGSLAAAALAVGLAIFSACGGGKEGSTPAPGPSPVTSSDARPERGDIYGVPQQRDVPPASPLDARPAGPDAGRGPAAPIYGVPDDIAPAPPDARKAEAPRPPRPRPELPGPEPLYGVTRDD